MKAIIIPLAIVFGSALIASAVFFKDYGSATPAPTPSAAAQRPAAAPTGLPNILENVDAFRTEARHLYGSETAAITIVEFSDYECPFCARLSPTLKRIVDESNGAINWEYRHLPLPMHQNAFPAAIASECVASLVSNDAFWKYSDVLLSNIGKANAAFLKSEAIKLGLEGAAYDSCIADPATKAIVDADVAAVTKFGQQGTPFSIVVNNADKSGRPVVGAVPYEQWKVVLETIK
ncbi:DsbA family protein [Patescibacteria group bacterium]|nr:DsbA family protein [Patescibacteria group bacterium]